AGQFVGFNVNVQFGTINSQLLLHPFQKFQLPGSHCSSLCNIPSQQYVSGVFFFLHVCVHPYVHQFV
ncbi:hypothetical protein J5751_06255, partial [bacterium]|nr:hypothetical protein [bacterium]